MAGRLGAEALAAVSIGASVMISVFITLSGVAAALNPLVAHHIGAQQPERFHRAGKACGYAGLRPAGRAGAAGRRALGVWMIGLEAPVAASAEGYLQGVAMGMPAALPYRALHALFVRRQPDAADRVVISSLALERTPCSTTC